MVWNLFFKKPEIGFTNTRHSLVASTIEWRGMHIHLRRRARQKRLVLSVKPNGEIQVSSNLSTSLETFQRFLLQNLNWLEKAIKRNQEKSAIHKVLALDSDVEILFMGIKRRLLGADQLAGNDFFLAPNSLTMIRGEGLLKDQIISVYKRQAAQYLPQRLLYWGDCMQLFPKHFAIRKQKTMWGSCSVDGKITLNFKLMAFSAEVIDYVLIHELAHLRHHNHSINFWRLVAQFCPTYKELRRQLRLKQDEARFLE